MRTNVSTLFVPALCCLLVAGARISSADDATGPASAANSIPNMTCTPFPRAQEQMPPSQWNDCVGTYTYQDRNVYSGEFRHGHRDGFGVLEINFIGQSSDNVVGWREPAIYVGSFRDGRLNGYGLLIAKSRVAYAGTFKDNIAQADLTQKDVHGRYLQTGRIALARTVFLTATCIAVNSRTASRKASACFRSTLQQVLKTRKSGFLCLAYMSANSRTESSAAKAQW